MTRLVLVGTDHHHVEPAVLGALPDRETLLRALREERARGSLLGFAVLATCNRVEIVAEFSAEPGRPGSFEGKASIDRISKPFDGVSHYVHEGVAALRHLIRVAGSLESMVLGENQILGQVKRALQAGDDAGEVSPLLGDALRTAIRGARAIRNSTGLGTQPVSVASLAVHALVQQLEKLPHRPRVAVIGAGTMARKAAPALRAQLDADITFVNRSVERAEELAGAHDGQALSLDAFLAHPTAVDAILVAARAKRALVNHALLRRIEAAGSRVRAIADVCVPAGVSEDAHDHGAVLIDMSRLKKASEANDRERHEAAKAAEPIVDHHVRVFENRFQQRSLGLGQIQRDHVQLAERELDALARELATLDERSCARLRSKILGLAKAHAHLHLADVKQRIAQ